MKRVHSEAKINEEYAHFELLLGETEVRHLDLFTVS